MRCNIKKIGEYPRRLSEEISAKNFAADFFASLVVVWTLISRIPLPKKWWPEQSPPGNKILSASPLAAAALGLTHGLFMTLLLRLGMGTAAAAWLGAALYSACGWTLHLDGWGDLWDGIGSGKRGEELRSVIKDSRLGAYGAVGLILALGLWTSLTAALPAGKTVVACAAAAAAGRLACCACASAGRYPWESGMAKETVGKFGGYDLFFSLVSTFPLFLLAPIEWFFSVIMAVLTGFGLARQMNRLLGGTNGDVLGAAAVAAEIFSLAVFALC